MTRPTWDNYFMNIAHVVKTRSNCIKKDLSGQTKITHKNYSRALIF